MFVTNMWGRIHLLGVVVIALALSLALPAAGFAHMAQSVNVALIPDDGSSSNGGILPTSGTVTGADGDSFDQFSFTQVPLDSLNAATLAQYDTVVLMQVSTADLTPSAEQALSQFVTNGGKLIIHDADSTTGNDYSWLPVPAQTGQSCQNCGDTSGTSQVIENNTLVSANPSDSSYVNVSEFEGNTDAVGDANVMVTQDPRWFVDIRATNSLGQTGAVDTYASDNGLIIFNGYDTDALGSTQTSGVDWLAKMWYQELAQGWDPDGLPHGTPVAPPAPTNYVALGDSYSSGEGDPPYLNGTDTKGDRCHRSALSYPFKANIDLGFFSPHFSFDACSGAVIADFTAANRANHEPPQLQWVNANTKLVTLTIGGNDAHFADVMLACVINTSNCVSKWSGAVDRAISKMASSSGNLSLQRLYERAAKAAPRARILVLGYPRFFPRKPPLFCSSGFKPFLLSRAAMDWINGEVSKMDKTIKDAVTNARANDPMLSYVDVSSAFKGHEWCTHSPDVNGAIPTLHHNIIVGSFHPNPAGHRALANLVDAAYEKP